MSTRASVEDAMIARFPSLWALRYKTIKGKPTTFVSNNPFKHRPWQQQILDDNHPTKVIEKSRQLGLSECGLTEVLHFLIFHEAVKVMYIFPRQQQISDFSKSRIAPVLQDAYFQPLLDPNNNSLSIKRIASSYLFMRSGWSGAIGEGVDTDALYGDEYDRLSNGAILAFREGLKSSVYGWNRMWSTPTIPGRGINLEYSMSDQRRWIHTCPHCGHRQFLTLDDNLIQVKDGVHYSTGEVEDGTFIIGCSHCHLPLDRMQTGEWQPQAPHVKETHGYHISQLDAAWITGDDIMRRRLTYKSKQLFFNYVVGEPYANEGVMVTDDDIRAAVRLPHPINSRHPQYVAIIAGIDWGDVSYMTILGMRSNGAVDMLALHSVRDDPRMPLRSVSTFCAILRAYQPNIVVADAGYGADRNTYGCTQFPASWYSCYWTTSKSADSRVRFRDLYNEAMHEITVDKTVKIQRTLHSLKGHLIGMFPWCEQLEEFAQHVKNTRIMDEEDGDGMVYQRATRIGADHYMCALTYALIGVDKLTNFNVTTNNRTPVEFI